MRERLWVWISPLIALAVFGAAGLWVWFGLLDGGDVLDRAAIDGLAHREAAPAPGGDPGTADQDDAGDGEADEQVPEVLNVLVAGSDSRAGLDNGAGRGARPDTIIVAQMRVDGSDAALLSIPRDLRVRSCDGSTDRINAAFAVASRLGIEGGSCLVQTVTDVTGIPIHHYVEVDMAGFVEVVDTIGGVEMCFDEPKGRHGGAGCHAFDGSAALAFVRDRSLDGRGDFGRMERQQQFLKAVADEVADARFLANIPRLSRTLDQVKGNVTTDEALDLRTIRSIASAFRSADSGAIVGATVPGDPRMIGGVAYVIMREDEAEELFEVFREGRAHDHLIEAELEAAGR